MLFYKAVYRSPDSFLLNDNNLRVIPSLSRDLTQLHYEYQTEFILSLTEMGINPIMAKGFWCTGAEPHWIILGSPKPPKNSNTFIWSFSANI